MSHPATSLDITQDKDPVFQDLWASFFFRPKYIAYIFFLHINNILCAGICSRYLKKFKQAGYWLLYLWQATLR